MTQYRWNPYVLLSDDQLDSTFKEHFSSESKVLLIMSQGFDVRMNLSLKQLISSSCGLDITPFVIAFNEGQDSASHSNEDLVNANMTELFSLVEESKVLTATLELWSSDGDSRRRVGDRRAANLIDTLDLGAYSDIIVDISALPRGIYFSLIGKLLTIVDKIEIGQQPNFMVTVAENPELDKGIIDDTPDENLNFLHGFGGGIDLSSDQEEPIVWLPILGENKLPQIKKAYNRLIPSEICPVLPFPSLDPRRPDSLIISYHEFLFDEVNVESQNLMYVPEDNPFEAYKILSRAIQNYNKSLSNIGGCKAVLSTFSSKLLSIGTLLAAYELKSLGIDVGVLNVDSSGYKIDRNLDLVKMKKDSKLFVIWLTGEPYGDLDKINYE